MTTVTLAYAAGTSPTRPSGTLFQWDRAWERRRPQTQRAARGLR
jgi:hypothetical protein